MNIEEEEREGSLHTPFCPPYFLRCSSKVIPASRLALVVHLQYALD